jgi:signal transduction histidine kinase
MSAGSWRRLPLFGQIAALLFVCVAAAQALSVVLIFMTPPPQGERLPVDGLAAALAGETPPELAALLTVTLEHRPPADDFEDPRETGLRLRLSRDLSVEPERVRAVLIAAAPQPGLAGYMTGRGGTFGPPPGPPPPGASPHGHGPAAAPWPRETDQVSAPVTVALETAPGLWRTAASRDPLLDAWRLRLLLWAAGSSAVVMALGYLFARRLAAPLAALAAAADRLGRDPSAPPLAVTGSREIAAAAQAFNVMGDRLRSYVEGRTRMVAAIAHDLRTPLTRLAFRMEAAPDDLRDKARGDLAEMEAMIAATMSFARDASRAARTRIELTSLAESIAVDLAETGAPVLYEPGPPVVIEADPVAVRSLVSNLVGNAIAYGKRARIRVGAAAGVAVIEVDDDGPGLPESELEKVFEPFYRVDASRSRDTGGVGLGLSIVRTVAQAHGGDAVLSNLPRGGLRARVTLPLGMLRS